MLTPSLALGMSLWDLDLVSQPSGCSDWLGWAEKTYSFLFPAKENFEQEAWLSFLLGEKQGKYGPGKGSPFATMMSLRVEKS